MWYITHQECIKVSSLLCRFPLVDPVDLDYPGNGFSSVQ